MEMAQAVITNIGKKKLCKAHAGDIELPPITKMAWGDGGLEESGTPKETTGQETALYNQLLEKDIEYHAYHDEGETSCRYVGKIEKSALVGKNISEIGLVDADGDLVAYKTFLAKGKDEDIPMTFNMDEVF